MLGCSLKPGRLTEVETKLVFSKSQGICLVLLDEPVHIEPPCRGVVGAGDFKDINGDSYTLTLSTPKIVWRWLYSVGKKKAFSVGFRGDDM